MSDFTVIDESPCREEGGNIITVKWSDNQRISIVHPSKCVEADWYIKTTGRIERVLIEPGETHSNETILELRRRGFKSAGRILRK